MRQSGIPACAAYSPAAWLHLHSEGGALPVQLAHLLRGCLCYLELAHLLLGCVCYLELAHLLLGRVRNLEGALQASHDPFCIAHRRASVGATCWVGLCVILRAASDRHVCNGLDLVHRANALLASTHAQRGT
eukprot:1158269-Pelagomonas_calceolata.AAC.2